MLTYSNHVLQLDLQEIINRIDDRAFNNKTIVITGANGLIATYLAYFFLHLVLSREIHLRLILISRDLNELKRKFEIQNLTNENLVLIGQDVTQKIPYLGQVDYIFHFAGNASPYWIKNDPVGIMKSNIIGTFNFLELAKQSDAKFIYASTREVYGEVSVNEITESTFGSLNCLDTRSCYPESKRVCESICRSYNTQFQTKFNIARIAHVYGPGMKLTNDGRVMSDMIDAAVNNKNIILKSQGLARRSFCYITDAIIGLLTITLKGKENEVYNLSNEFEEITITDLAALMLKLFPERIHKIIYNGKNTDTKLYCGYKRVKLNTSKLNSLGWKPTVGLTEGVCRTVKSFLI